ncbi:MAG: hypothetical protein NDI90_05815 [Nitrospira sp. BO4]|nr:hypothetical protein [Nitrospira sp. BO4]
MPTYKQRRIELTPICQADGTWQCSYAIIEFKQACWRCQEGQLESTFSSSQEAKSAAWKEAKRIVDAFEPYALPPLRPSRLRDMIH